MADTLAGPVEFGPMQEMLSAEMLQVLTAGDASRLAELLSSEGQTNGGHVAIIVQAATPDAAAPPGQGAHSCLLGVTSNGSTALHVVASRGHAELAALICKKAPSLVATRNRSLDTPLHCAARGGHREVAACFLSTMRSHGVEEATALKTTNRLGDTALHEAVRQRRAEVVDLLMAEAPELASVPSEDGVSPLYFAAITKSVQIVRLLLRPLPDGTPSPASPAGRKGRTALHAAATVSKDESIGVLEETLQRIISLQETFELKSFYQLARNLEIRCTTTLEMTQEILAWEPEGPALLTRVDSSGKSPLHYAVLYANLDVVELLLNANSHLARISDNKGLYPVHHAAAEGSTKMIDELIRNCPEHYELVDDKGWNLLHAAIVANNDIVVRYICQNERFSLLLNMTDFNGNTPLHLAVKYGYPCIVSLLLQTTGVEVDINNRDGLTAWTLAHDALPVGRLLYLVEPAVMVLYMLWCAGASTSFDSVDIQKNDESAKQESAEDDYTRGTIGSALIASVTFAAAFTVPGGFIADDHPHPGTAILARRFAFRAFVVSDTVAFLWSMLSTGFLIYSGISGIPRGLRFQYTSASSVLVPMAAQFMTAAFAFGLHLVLGVTNRWLVFFVYIVASVSVLFISPSTWLPLHFHGFAKAIWRRAGWTGLLNMRKRPSGLLDLLIRFFLSPLARFSGDSFALPLCATFFIAIALEIAFPNY